jgi:hypothetical protein
MFTVWTPRSACDTDPHPAASSKAIVAKTPRQPACNVFIMSSV